MKLFAIPLTLATVSLIVGCAQERTQPAVCCGGVCCTLPPPAENVAPADAPTADALRTALADERRAHAWYEAVMKKHGRVRPFANIVHAEQRHAQLVETLMARYGVTVPEERIGDLPPVPATLAACCGVAADLERENIAMYDGLLAKVTESDIQAAFTRLQAVSRNNHLPAFERWVN